MQPRRPITIEAATLKAESLCARAEYSQSEIFKRLIGWGVSHPDARKIVERLVDEGFIDDHRFAMAYARQQAVYARWGQRKIAMAMRLKGIDRYTVDEALSSIEAEEWRNSAIALALHKAKAYETIDYETKVKIYRHLASRGFDSATINVALRHITLRND